MIHFPAALRMGVMTSSPFVPTGAASARSMRRIKFID
jgi:hypothetical protein